MPKDGHQRTVTNILGGHNILQMNHNYILRVLFRLGLDRLGFTYLKLFTNLPSLFF